MQGLQIDLDIPATQMRSSQPPLRGTSLPASLLDYSADLLPGGSDRPAPAPDVTFALGDTLPRPAQSGLPAPTGPRRPGWPPRDGDGGATARPGRWPPPRPPHPKGCEPPYPASPNTSAAPPRAARDGGRAQAQSCSGARAIVAEVAEAGLLE
jgi:hypothetical protein